MENINFHSPDKMPGRQYKESKTPEVTVWGRITEETFSLLKENELTTDKKFSDDQLEEKIAYALRIYKDRWAKEFAAAEPGEETKKMEKDKADFLARRVEELLYS
jgi:hypothetical protein